MSDFVALAEVRAEAMGGVVQIVAILLTVVSAYATALYLFIARASFLMRFLAFFILTSGFLFLGFMTLAYRLVLAQLEDCPGIGCAPEGVSTSVDLFGLMNIEATVLRDTSILLGFSVATLLYVILVLMTFFTGWRRRDDIT